MVTNDPALGEPLSELGAKTLVHRCSTLAESTRANASQRATVYVSQGLGQRIRALTAEANQTEIHLRALLQQRARDLISRTGIGLDSAAEFLIVAGGNPDRIRTEGSSGNTQRRRLNPQRRPPGQRHPLSDRSVPTEV